MFQGLGDGVAVRLGRYSLDLVSVLGPPGTTALGSCWGGQPISVLGAELPSLISYLASQSLAASFYSLDSKLKKPVRKMTPLRGKDLKARISGGPPVK